MLVRDVRDVSEGELGEAYLNLAVETTSLGACLKALIEGVG